MGSPVLGLDLGGGGEAGRRSLNVHWPEVRLLCAGFPSLCYQPFLFTVVLVLPELTLCPVCVLSVYCCLRHRKTDLYPCGEGQFCAPPLPRLSGLCWYQEAAARGGWLLIPECQGSQRG